MGTVANAEMRPRLLVARGARAAEQLVLARIAELADETVADVSLLGRPVWVVVPSRSLRLHLAERLIARRGGRAVAGIEIRTLHGLAAGIITRCREALVPGHPLLPVLVRRHASREPALAELVLAFEDGEIPVHTSVRDLIDAGFQYEHGEAMAELLAERGSHVEEARALALVRVAAGVTEELAGLGLSTGADVLRRAAELVAADPERALPARAVLVHGFADATGVATDLIEALLRHRATTVFLDEPPDPADADQPDLGVVFGRRLKERLQGVAPPEPALGPASDPLTLELVQAPGAHAEGREVARRIRALADGGASFEQIGVVARDLAGYVSPIHLHFSRLGIPYSALDAPLSRDAAARCAGALAELLRRGDETPADVWLAAMADPGGFDVYLALRVCGAARLRDVAALDPGAMLNRNDDLPLPVRRGLTEQGEGDDEASAPVAPRRKLSGRCLRWTVQQAVALTGRLRKWPAEASLAKQFRTLWQILGRDLGWRGDSASTEAAQQAIHKLADALPANLVLGRDEFIQLVRRALAGVGGARLGGAGGGVQLLSVTEARGRTFAHLFVLGLNRDAFPRQVREDPLLPDHLRASLGSVLPDIPIKRLGFDEERYLFAQLVSAAEHVTLSWQACDDDGKARQPSPLVERLRLVARLGEAPLAPPALDAGGPEDLRPAHERAVLAGLHASRVDFGDVLELAYKETGVSDAKALAAARLAVVEELDPDRRSLLGRVRAAHLGPYFGFVGEIREAADPRRAPLAVTTAENVSRCPWQTFLRRILHLETSPDPLVELPGVDALLVGSAVHAILERIVRHAAPGVAVSLDEALAGAAVAVPWPDDQTLDSLIGEACSDLLRSAGLALPGLERVLRAQVAPYLDVARRVAWPESGGVEVLGVEVAGTVPVEHGGQTRTLAFRADRLERSDGELVFTDFKSGKPISAGKQASTRRRHFIASVNSGRTLQAVAYAVAAGARPAQGRYLFLRPDLGDEARLFAVASEDGELRQAFTTTMGAILDVWDRGTFFPRLEEAGGGNEPQMCTWCEVRDACLRGDSAARRRLARWAAPRAAGLALAPAEAALTAMWNLGRATEGGSGSGEENE